VNGWRKASTTLLQGKNSQVPIGEEDGWDLKLILALRWQRRRKLPTLLELNANPRVVQSPPQSSKSTGCWNQHTCPQNIVSKKITRSQLQLLQSMNCLVSDMTAGRFEKKKNYHKTATFSFVMYNIVLANIHVCPCSVHDHNTLRTLSTVTSHWGLLYTLFVQNKFRTSVLSVFVAEMFTENKGLEFGIVFIQHLVASCHVNT